MPWPNTSRIVDASSLVSCAHRSSNTSRQPSAASLPSVTCRVLSRMLSLSPERRVCTSPTERATKGATRSRGPFEAAASMQRTTTLSGAANGMILTVATICLGSTIANGGRVPSVTVSSTRLSRLSRSGSNTRSPRVLAKRLARPVNGAAASISTPATAAATCQAASSSPISPGSSRATTIRDKPEAAISSTSACDSTRAFFSAVVPSFRLCARIAPSASVTGTSPNFTPPPPPRRDAGFVSSRQRSRSPLRQATPRRLQARSAHECEQDHHR